MNANIYYLAGTSFSIFSLANPEIILRCVLTGWPSALAAEKHFRRERSIVSDECKWSWWGEKVSQGAENKVGDMRVK